MRRRRHALVGVFVLIVTCGVAARARAAQTTVAPLVPEVSPAVSAEVVARFQEALAAGLGRLGDVAVVPPADVRRQLAGEPEHCPTTACRARLAARLGAARLVAASILVVGKAYGVTLSVYDAEGREVAHIERRCEICTLREAEHTVAQAVAELAPALAPPAPPASAPASRPAPPASAPTIQPWEHAAPPAAPPPPAPTFMERLQRFTHWRLTGIIAAGVGVFGIALGAPLLAIAGEPTCDLPDPRHTCPEVYATGVAGGLLVTLGALAAVASGAAFYLDWRFGRTRAGVEAAPVERGAGAVLRARLQW